MCSCESPDRRSFCGLRDRARALARSSRARSAARVDDAFGQLGLRLGLPGLRGELSSIWLAASLMNVPGPNTTLTVCARAELPARPVRAALRGQRRGGHVARQAALEADQALDVRAQHELLQVALDEHPIGSSPKLRRSAGSRGTPSSSSRRTCSWRPLGCSLTANTVASTASAQTAPSTVRASRGRPVSVSSSRAIRAGPGGAPAAPARRRGGASPHPERSGRFPGEELADERVLGGEQLLGRTGFHDPSLPQDRDVSPRGARS